MLFTFAHPDSNFAKKEMNMPEKQKSSHTWKSPKTIIAAAAVTSLLTMWNTFATHDRQRRGELDMSADRPSVNSEADRQCSRTSPEKNLGGRCVSVTQTRSS